MYTINIINTNQEELNDIIKYSQMAKGLKRKVRLNRMGHHGQLHRASGMGANFKNVFDFRI